MTTAELKKRQERCTTEKLCFISLKPLDDKAISLYHGALKEEVKVLSAYSNPPTK